MSWRFVVLAVILATLDPSRAHSQPVDATVRIVSHGASGVVLWTGPDRTLILTVAHAFEGPARSAPLAIDVPTAPGTRRATGPGTKRVIAIDKVRDLAVVELRSGPLPSAVHVSGRSPAVGAACLSVGYDGMGWPAVAQATTVVATDARATYTRHQPKHGRSGGALLDRATGLVIGICQGYENTGERRGVYASRTAILEFWESVRDVPGRSGSPAVREERSFAPWGDQTRPHGRRLQVR